MDSNPELTKKERQELKGIVAISTTMFRVGAFLLVTTFIALFFFNILAWILPNPNTLTFHLSWIIPTFLLLFIIYIKSGRWTGGRKLRQNVREDLLLGTAVEEVFEAYEAIRVEENEDEGIGFILRLNDGRTFLAQGQEIDQWTRKGFPWRKFKLRFAPRSGLFLGVRKAGEKLEITSARDSLTSEESSLFPPGRSFVVLPRDFDKFQWPNKSMDST